MDGLDRATTAFGCAVCCFGVAVAFFIAVEIYCIVTGRR